MPEPCKDRCDRCGGKLACWYTRRGKVIGMCHTCSDIYAPAFDAQGWKVMVPA
jgi:hypothetical protein